MYNIIYETSRQSRFNARYWILGAGALGQPRGMVRGRRREEGSGWGTHVCLRRIHFDIWQNQYNIIKFKNKIKSKKKKKRRRSSLQCRGLLEKGVESLGEEDPLEESTRNPLQYSCLENPMGRGAWWTTVHSVGKSHT